MAVSLSIMTSKINLLIVDDEALLRQGLRAMLEKELFVQEIYEADDETSFTAQLTSHHIDIILLDIRLRKVTGLELLRLLHERPEPQPKVIAVTGLDGIELIINLLKSGIHGIVYKLDGYDEIIKSVKAVMNSDSYFPERILKIIQSNYKQWDTTPAVTLSFQEKELLKAIATGATTKEIAVNLKMAEGTAETYRVRLMKKVGVSNTAALLAFAYRNGIL
jgi:DNA-binding NarL/FixJ family response regulator